MLTATEPRAAARGRRPRSALMACCAAAALLPLAAAGCAQQRVQVAPVVAVDGERLPAAEAAATAADPYERGKAHLRDGRPGLALQAFRAALAARPDAVMALNGIGVAYDQLGRFDLAERYYHRALALNPDAAETHNNLGYSALRQGKATLARRHFARAHELSPGDAVVVAKLDRLAWDRGAIVYARGHVVRLAPPLCITREEVDQLVDIVAASIDELEAGLTR